MPLAIYRIFKSDFDTVNRQKNISDIFKRDKQNHLLNYLYFITINEVTIE